METNFYATSIVLGVASLLAVYSNSGVAGPPVHEDQCQSETLD